MGKTNINFSRRNFLKAGVFVSSATLSTSLLSGCTTLDKAFSGEKKYFDDEVLILGAGVAGLSAAYTLKKNKIPFRIFEASSRVGGRIYTLQDFAGENSFAELGGDFFDESHKRIFQFCKELGIKTQEVKRELKPEDALYFLAGKFWSARELKKYLTPLYSQLAQHNRELFSERETLLTVDNVSQFAKASYYDSLNAEDFIMSLGTDVDPWLLTIFSLHVRTRFGAETKSLSALQLLQHLNREPNLNFMHSRGSYRIVNGAGQLTSALFDRVAGVIPDYVVKVQSPLSRIRMEGNGFRLDFKPSSGNKSYTARQIICTLPFSTLREVEGIKDLPFSATKKELISLQPYAMQTKAVMDFSEAFWKKKSTHFAAFSGDLTGDFLSQNFSDSTQEGSPAMLSVLRGELAGAKVDNQVILEAIQDLEKIKTGATALMGPHQSFMNWGTRASNKGSRALFAPGQYAKFSGVAGQSECNGQFLFAGEHTSLEYQGTIEGAVGSGISAAETIVRKIKEAV